MSKDDKEKFVDLIVYYKDQIIGIELNNNATGDYLRNALYITNAINNSYISGDSYDKITQGILVNLNWFTDANAKRYKEGVIEEIWTYPSLNKNRPEYFVKFINVNLLSFQDMCYNDVTKENYLWKLFTIKKKNELDDLVEKEKLLIEYRDKLHRLSCNKEYCRMVWDERIEKNLRKREDYLLGISEGIDQKQKEMIINMYKEKIDINTISKISNMSIDDVEQIINSKDEKQE